VCVYVCTFVLSLLVKGATIVQSCSPYPHFLTPISWDEVRLGPTPGSKVHGCYLVACHPHAWPRPVLRWMQRHKGIRSYCQ